ncbi:hypothetical protein [Helicobacter typhlonius]|uniref:hypothetical protein n=1 Tax=Helicobacter typhlonius TaxID=76936 RepID=UPI002FE0A9A9
MKFLLINTNQIVQKLVEITAKKAGAKITSITESSKMGDLTQYDYVIIDDDCLLLDEQTYIDSLKDKHKCLIYNKGTKRIEGFDDYIQKPFLPTSILDIFTEQLKKNAHIADEESDLLAGEDISLDNLDDSLDKIDSLLAEEDSLDEPTKTDISIEDKTNDDILGDEELGADVAEDSITDEATAEDDKSSESTEDVDVSLDASLDESTQDEADLSGDDLFDDEEKLSLEDDVSKSVFDEEQVSEVSQALNALEEPSMGGGDDDFSALKEPEIAQALGEDIPDLGEDTQEMDDVLENSQGAEDSMDLDSVESAHIESISQDSQETSTSQEFVKNIIASSVQSSIANLRNDNLKSMLDGLEVTINISFKDKSK